MAELEATVSCEVKRMKERVIAALWRYKAILGEAATAEVRKIEHHIALEGTSTTRR